MPDFRARSNVEIIDAAFQIYSKNFSVYFALGLLGALPALGSFVGRTKIQIFMTQHLTAFILLVIVALIVVFLAYCSYILLTSDLYHGKPVDFDQIFTRAGRRFIPYFIANLLGGLLIGIGFVLFIIPGIILLLRLCLIMPVSMLEDGSGTDPLYRSAVLTKGHGWKIFLMGLAVLLISMINSLLTQLSLLIPASTVGIVVGYLIAAAVNPLPAIIGTIFYYDLRIRTEGYDIQALAADMPRTPAPAGA